MSDRERDRDHSAVPRVRRYRCATCKAPIIANRTHTCVQCGLCNAFFDRGGPSGHRCEVYFDDEDEKAISAEVERRVQAAIDARPSMGPVPL